ncbi:endoglucanase D precursor [Saccharicrinis fermentans DSM 9555 = JCM 21142]|uniref:Endoglucanase D n=2 Tax=Saccharicrinis fermentans TaxID=982 RepID=W7YH82_9BACT|nr:endoglucanase D precursor [Saccharicrinis fermentans DSM 9555 = JCM 21142]
MLACCSACEKSDKTEKAAPEFKSSMPADGAQDVYLDTDVKVVFDEVVTLAPDHGITINNSAANVEVSFTTLVFTVDLQSNTTYQIIIPQGSVVNTFGVPLSTDIKISFATKEINVSNSEDMEFVADMGVGWNLGNTLDTKHKDKTNWGNPAVTKALIDAVRAKGFKTLRLPVTWQYNMGSSPDYVIEPDFLNRVEEVVNYGLDNDMYVIVNIHHDEDWIIPTYERLDNVKEQLVRVWTQIAAHFKTYDDKLIFETLNEPRLIGSNQEWTGGTAEGRDCVNQLHRVAVEAIRATGDNNASRYIMISPYAASSSQVAIESFQLPTSTRLIVSVHSYFPYTFALAEDNYVTSWGTEAEQQALDAELNRLVDQFIDQGIPVVMGEWGSLNHGNLEDRTRHAAYYSTACLSRGIPSIWWDNGNLSEFGLIDRTTYQWAYIDIANAIVEH